MYTKKINYVGVDGVERSESFYFNLTETDIMKMQLSETGGLADKIQRAIDRKDSKEIMRAFDILIDSSYGIKSEDGRGFLKSPEILAEFKSTNAYNKFFMDLCTVEGEAAAFFNAVVPSTMREQLAAEHPELTILN